MLQVAGTTKEKVMFVNEQTNKIEVLVYKDIKDLNNNFKEIQAVYKRMTEECR